MGKNNERLTGFLEKQLERTTTWLSFAEAKNAAIVAFNIALAQICFDSLEKANIPAIIYLALSALAIATFISLSSFAPKLFAHPTIEPKGLGKKERPINLLFFGSIAEISDEKELLQEIKRQYFQDDSNIVNNQMDTDLGKELLENSRIANRKYKLFNCALAFDILTIVMLVVDYVVPLIS